MYNFVLLFSALSVVCFMTMSLVLFQCWWGGGKVGPLKIYLTPIAWPNAGHIFLRLNLLVLWSYLWFYMFKVLLYFFLLIFPRPSFYSCVVFNFSFRYLYCFFFLFYGVPLHCKWNSSKLGPGQIIIFGITLTPTEN